MRVKKLNNGKAAGKGEMIKVRGDRVVDWLCNIAFESSVVPEHWRSAMIVPV